MKPFAQLVVLISVSALSACAPAIGSKEWCEDLDKKPKGEWTFEEAGDYTKHCIIRDDD